ncbi:MAG TPA: TatD family deoxyribonuclease [Bacillus bacterium]|uniref:TatD-related deoxyribonuclease n=1 Tax=Siminovitchia fordii TaxID=254759 RepID=A0ABQ4K1H7_9BACI|nr:TatD family hydrolase [Siminovitchia fordii]GIN19587.1 TatD-related deoxyribonuclease [Siminovitchia fordii]HBZ11502.1 TatD family deoxyribonuclease [Bacillus sp. (in: firmicutes)]
MKEIIDSHIHLDLYSPNEVDAILAGLDSAGCTDVISVSYHLESCLRNLLLAEKYCQVHPAFGFHPEQKLPSDSEIQDLFSWMEKHKEQMVAVGEVGLPYYLRSEKGDNFAIEGYIELLDQFILRAKNWNKPVILHAVYDDAPIACELMEKHGVEKAHFHWFKGDSKTVRRMIENGWFISITPDVIYEQEIQELVKQYPLEQMMVETDGPWRFKGQFSQKMTHPGMIHDTVAAIASIKNYRQEEVYQTFYKNTVDFYKLNLV